MKRTIAVLAATSFMASPSGAGDGPRLRYRDVSSPISVAVYREIDVGEMKSIDRVRASSEAHGQRQRLRTRHLRSRSFTL